MIDITLTRALYSANGTFGILSSDMPLCLTCELPWNDNEPDKSCIPTGFYDCMRHISPKFPLGNTWEVTNVPGRTGILMHAANDIAELEGCIAVGQMFGILNNLPAVLHSAEALAALNKTLGDTFVLTIKD